MLRRRGVSRVQELHHALPEEEAKWEGVLYNKATRLGETLSCIFEEGRREVVEACGDTVFTMHLLCERKKRKWEGPIIVQ